MTDLTPEAIIDKKKAYLFPNQLHFYKNPPHIIKGDMQYLYDSNGKRYTDFFAGVTVVNCGHCNAYINHAVAAQLGKLQHTSVIYLTQPMVDLAEKLSAVLPGDMHQTFFCNSGTEANEGALLLARMATGRKKFIAFEGGLHGRSALTMSVTGIPMWRIDPFPEEGVYFAPSFAVDGEPVSESAEASLSAVREILSTHGDEIAACIVEPIQGNGGMKTPPKDFFKRLKALLEAHGVLLIADEVQTGFARTGHMFAMEAFDVVPDIMTMAKALGNGIPIGAFSARPEVAKAFNKPSASTLGGNPVSATAGLAVLDYIEKHDLTERSARLGELLKTALQDIANAYADVTAVRGMGLMLGMVFKTDGGAEKVDAILETMKDRGFIIGKNGMARNVLAFQPPLVIGEEDIRRMTEALAEVMAEVMTAV
jgi:4-aminobutyrate aminotransferase